MYKVNEKIVIYGKEYIVLSRKKENKPSKKVVYTLQTPINDKIEIEERELQCLVEGKRYIIINKTTQEKVAFIKGQPYINNEDLFSVWANIIEAEKSLKQLDDEYEIKEIYIDEKTKAYKVVQSWK